MKIRPNRWTDGRIAKSRFSSRRSTFAACLLAYLATGTACLSVLPAILCCKSVWLQKLPDCGGCLTDCQPVCNAACIPAPLLKLEWRGMMAGNWESEWMVKKGEQPTTKKKTRKRNTGVEKERKERKMESKRKWCDVSIVRTHYHFAYIHRKRTINWSELN